MSQNGHVLSNEQLSDVQKRLGVRFKNPELLREVLSELSSWNGRKDHLRWVEFIGDRVIGLATSQWLFRRANGTVTAAHREKMLAIYSYSVSNGVLAKLSVKLGLCWQVNGVPAGRKRAANVFEMVVAAIYRDQGLETTVAFLERTLFAHVLPQAKPPKEGASRGKLSHAEAILQRDARKLFGKDPEYKQLGVDEQQFVLCAVFIGELYAGMGKGPTFQDASLAAAQDAFPRLRFLKKKNPQQCDAVPTRRRWKR